MEQIIQSYNDLFWKMTKSYNLDDSNLLRKFIHSYDVAKNCYTLACIKNFNENQKYFCYLMGLFHDIGRFEQWKLYHTYDDTKSIDQVIYQLKFLINIT